MQLPGIRKVAFDDDIEHVQVTFDSDQVAVKTIQNTLSRVGYQTYALAETNK